MILPTIITFWILLSQTTAAAVVDPMITPAPFLPTHENLRRLAQERRHRKRDATTGSAPGVEDEMISYCYAEGGICDLELSIFHNCRASNGPLTQSIDFPKLEVCECQSGYWAADQACGWCQLAFNSSDSVILDASTFGISVCSKHSIPLAPIPASVEVLLSSWNASYTGVKSVAQGAAPSTSGPGSSSTDLTKIGTGTTTSTFVGGGGGEITVTPSVSIPGVASTSAKPNSSSRNNIAQDWGVMIGLALVTVITCLQ